MPYWITNPQRALRSSNRRSRALQTEPIGFSLRKELVVLLAGAIVGIGSGFATVAWQMSTQAARSDVERQRALLFETSAKVERDLGSFSDAVEDLQGIVRELADDIGDGKLDGTWLYAEYADLVERNRKVLDRNGDRLLLHTFLLQLYALGLTDERPDFSSDAETPPEIDICATTVDRVLRKRMPLSVGAPKITACAPALMRFMDEQASVLRRAQERLMKALLELSRRSRN